ncbi:MAG: AIR synthase family protein [bacterium]|nr:AIR synthase family protein [bacterium]
MSVKAEFPAIGKISPEFFNAVIYPSLGAVRPEVLVGPRHGVDTAVVRIGPGRVMVVTTDPIYIVPGYGWEEAAWFAWHILASDVTTSGFPPAYVVVDFNLPMGVTEDQFARLWGVFHRESEKYGAAVISGHTARYTGTDYPMVGGATFIAVGDEDAYLTPAMAGPGDVLCMTKSAAVEAVGIFSRLFRERIASELGEQTAASGWEIFNRMSTVDDALAAAGFGVRGAGVTAMHDATECGVVGAAVEMAEASGAGLELDYALITVYPEVRAICRLFGMQPEIAISEGTLLLAVRGDRYEEFREYMEERGAPVAKIGRFLPGSEGITALRDGGRIPLAHPRVDPFWGAFDRATRA